MKPDIWDIFIILGWLMIGVGIWFMDWRASLIINGGLLIYGGGKAMRK